MSGAEELFDIAIFERKIELIEHLISVVSRRIGPCDTAEKFVHCKVAQTDLGSKLDDLVFPK